MPPSPKRLPLKVGTWEGVTIAFAGALFFSAICSSILPNARTHDFLGFYTGGLLVRTDSAHLYDPELQSKIQYGLAPEIPVFTPIPRPAFSLPAYIPLTWMPLKTAFAVWLAAGILTAFGIWYWAFKRFGAEALIYCSLFVPLGFGIAHGQDIAFVTGLLLLASVALERGRQELGGFLLSLLLCKFHLFLLLPVVLVFRREWRVLYGYIPGALAAVLISCWIASPTSYMAFLQNSKLEALNPSPEIMVNVYSIAMNFGLDFPIIRAVLVLLVIACTVMIPAPAPLERWFWATIAGGLLISPHTFGYDMALLLAPILKMICDHNASLRLRAIAALAVIPFPYFMTLLPMPFSAGPAILLSLIFTALAWPEWFDRRGLTTSGSETAPVIRPAASLS